MNEPFSAIIALSCYLLATILLGLRFRASRSALLWPQLIGSVGAAAHGVLLYNQAISDGGLHINFVISLSAFAWLAIVILGSATLRLRVANLGLVLFPFSIIAITLTFTIPLPHTESMYTPGQQTHIVLALLAYGCLTIGAVQALVTVAQHRRLRRHVLTMQSGWQPIETMEHLLFLFIRVGFVLLTLVLLTGFLFTNNLDAPGILHKVVLTVVAWVLLLALLLGRHVAGWRGAKACNLALLSYFFVVLAYFGTHFVIEFLVSSNAA